MYRVPCPDPEWRLHHCISYKHLWSAPPGRVRVSSISLMKSANPGTCVWFIRCVTQEEDREHTCFSVNSVSAVTFIHPSTVMNYTHSTFVNSWFWLKTILALPHAIFFRLHFSVFAPLNIPPEKSEGWLYHIISIICYHSEKNSFHLPWLQVPERVWVCVTVG